MKTKNWWKNLKYWQKGLIIGFIIGIVNLFLLGVLGFILFPLHYLLTLIFPSSFLATCGESCLGQFIILSSIEFIFLGGLIGFIIDKVKR